MRTPHPPPEAKARPRWLTMALATTLLGALAAGALGAGCTGDIGDPADGSTDDGNDCVGCTPDGIQVVESTAFPRMSHRQWENTVQDLFGLPAPTGLSATFAPDPLGGKAFDNNNASLEVTPSLWGDYQEAAEEVAETVTSDPALLAKVVPADLPSDSAQAARAFIEAFGKRAYRRPLTTAEVDELAALFDLGPTHYPDLDPFTAGVRLTLEGILQSPFFVYRPEIDGQVEGNQLVALDDWEMASRLSYTLWNTMPDDELFTAAENGELTSDEGLQTQIDRLLASDRARDMVKSFYDQLGYAQQYEHLSKSPTLYPDFDEAVGADMREELQRFVDDVIMNENGGVAELLTSRTTFVTESLAEIYGIDPSSLTFDADGFAKVELDPKQRSGLLTRAGFLAWRGTSSQPDTILRGVYINRRIICQELGDPPDAAMGAMLGDEETNRERVEALTGAGTCGSTCHGTFIDPIGYAFEGYGAIGEWRDQDNGHPVDATSTFPFREGAQSYDGAVQLSEILAQSPQVHECMSRYWIEYVLARDVVDADGSLIDQLAEESEGGASVKEVLSHLLSSAAFRYRLAATEVQP